MTKLDMPCLDSGKKLSDIISDTRRSEGRIDAEMLEDWENIAMQMEELIEYFQSAVGFW